ncbi:MAG: hypothetical protein IK143_06080 [Bacteroidales bacterium]|nr:hypothetical protein [Bacteroidales bacterium]
MKDNITGTLIWNLSMKSGLAFALLSVSCMLIKNLTGAILDGGMAVSLIRFVLWAIEFGGCIYLMDRFMQNLTTDFEGVTRSHTFAYGRRIALFSSILVAGAGAIYTALNQDLLIAEYDKAMAAYASMMDSNTLAIIEDFRNNLPVITLISTFIYCYLYGIILSAIISTRHPSRNPFANQ